eukprot:3175065-Amphidinium_carterae.1
MSTTTLGVVTAVHPGKRDAAALIPADLPCRYVTQAGTCCENMLDRHGSHVFTCAHGPSIHRHNSVRDMWLRLMRLAGWHAVPEQDVLIQHQRVLSVKSLRLRSNA